MTVPRDPLARLIRRQLGAFRDVQVAEREGDAVALASARAKLAELEAAIRALLIARGVDPDLL